MPRYEEFGIPTLAAALLDHCNTADLRSIAALAGQGRLPTRKDELAEVIRNHLAGERLRAILDGMDGLQKAAVAETVHSEEGRFPADLFVAKYGREPAWSIPGPREHQRRPTSLALLFYGRGEARFVPEDLRERLRALVPAPAPAAVATVEAPPGFQEREESSWDPRTRQSKTTTIRIPVTLRETEHAARRELLSVLRFVDAGKCAVGDRTRVPSSATLAGLGAILDGGDWYPPGPPARPGKEAVAAEEPEDEEFEEEEDCGEASGPIRAFAWPLLLQAEGLARARGNHLALSKEGRAALSAPPAGTLRRIWEGWVRSSGFDEIARIECVKGWRGRGAGGLTDPADRRLAVAAGLAACPPGKWIPVESFERFLRASGNAVAVTEAPWYLYIGEQQYGSLGYGGGEAILDGRVLLCLLLESAATLGLLDVALVAPAGARRDFGSLWGTDDLPYFSRYDGLLAFRVNPLGAFALGRAAAYEPAPLEQRPALRVLPTREIVAVADPIEPGDALALDAYAERVSDRVWRLEAGSLLSALAAGRTVDEVRGFLRARSADPLPETVERLLADIADRVGKVRDAGAARLVECRDAALALLLSTDARTRRHCLRAGERHLAVPAASEAAFRRALREVGFVLDPGGTAGAKARRRSEETGPAAEAAPTSRAGSP